MNCARKTLSIVCIVAGILLAAYPWISNCVNDRAVDGEIRIYETTVENMAQQNMQRYQKEAMEYNNMLLKNNVSLLDPFASTLTTIHEGMPYEALLSYDRQGIMGSLEIPGIQVKLPIYHGTSSTVLEKGVGHLEGSSLPVGGESTHAVLTGHTGLNRAKLFTDLICMKQGDLFFINILDETLAYSVESLAVVLPEETDKLQIEEGKDKVTLITCTPYGVNDHRLLVQGVRTVYEENRYTREFQKDHTKDSQWIGAYKRALLAGMAAVLLFTIFWKCICKKMRERKAGLREKNCT